MSAVIPERSFEQALAVARAATEHAASLGVTSVQDMGPNRPGVYQELARRGELKTRIYAVSPLADYQRWVRAGVRAAFGGPMLRVGGLKGFTDGSLGSTTAWFFEPYLDQPDSTGLALEQARRHPDDVTGADAAGLQVMIHAIGDRANHEVLEVFGGPDDWDPAGLPEPQRRQVSWGDGILSVVVNAFLLTILLLPGRLGGDLEGFAWGQIFTDTAYSLRWVLAVGMAVSLLASVFVLARGRWTWPTALANAAGTVLFVGPLVWLAARDDLYAWHTLPTAWLNDSDGTFQVNEQSTLAVTIVVLVAIALWETWDTFYKASRAH